MSQENVSALRDLFARMKETGVLELDLFDPAVEFINFESFPIVQPYRGWDGVTAWMVDMSETFDDFGLELVEVLGDDDDHVVTICRATGESRTGGPSFKLEWGVVWTFRNGKVTMARGLRSGAEALEAVGLSE